jgi:hypothetical protein
MVLTAAVTSPRLLSTSVKGLVAGVRMLLMALAVATAWSM